MARSKSSNAWLQRHVADGYVRRAREAGLRSRAAFKLQEIDERERLLRAGARVVDLGGAPGGARGERTPPLPQRAREDRAHGLVVRLRAGVRPPIGSYG